MNEHRLHQAIEIGVLLKGAHALVECFGGVALYLVSTNTIAALVNTMTLEELNENPNDFIATYLLDLVQHLSVSNKQFYAFYLLSHGLIRYFSLSAS